MSIVPGRRIDLPDGRVVRTVEAGALGGVPILVLHPTPSSRFFVRQYADAALRTGARLIGFSRPGYGGSTMTTPGLRVVAEDALRVADAADVGAFSVLGFSGGTAFAAATAALCSDRVTAVGLCAAVAPWREVEDAGAEFDGELADLLDLADRDVGAALDGVRARAEREWADRLTLDDDALAERLRDEALPPDDEVLTSTVARGQVAVLREAFDQDEITDPPHYDGVAFDELAFGRRWDVDVRDVVAPTWIWQGSDDVVTPLDHARWYAARIPQATLTVREGSGHLGSFEGYRDEMLATLAHPFVE